LEEEIMSLKKSIRKNLEILQETKKVTLTEEKIVKGRFSVVPKNINKNSKIQVTKAFNTLLSENKSLKSQGVSQNLINENIIQALTLMFAEEGPRFIDTLKEKLAEYLKSKLQLTDVEEEIITNAIGNTEMDDIPELFNDPKYLANKIVQAYTEDMGSKYSIMNIEKGQQMVSNMEDELRRRIEPLIGDVNSNMELKLKGIRDNMLS
jgi:hypothetical protein